MKYALINTGGYYVHSLTGIHTFPTLGAARDGVTNLLPSPTFIVEAPEAPPKDFKAPEGIKIYV